jgi:hypothetical protein
MANNARKRGGNVERKYDALNNSTKPAKITWF